MTRFLRLLPLLLLLVLSAAGCAHPRAFPAVDLQKPQPLPEIEKYEEKPVSIPRYFRYLDYMRKVGSRLPNAPTVALNKQGMFEKTCGPCVIRSVGAYFGDDWAMKEIVDAVMGTHEQGTSVTAIVKWFTDKGYSQSILRIGDRSVESLVSELKAGSLVIALTYSFFDGYGPNHFVVISHFEDGLYNIVDSRFGEFSEHADFFMSRTVMTQGTWISVRK